MDEVEIRSTNVKITLGKLAKEGIEAHSGGDAAACVQTALLYYADRLQSARPPIPPPRFLDELHSCGAVEIVDPAIDAETQATLESEAHRRRTSVEELSAHAVLVYLAELDAVYQDTPEGLR